MATLTIFTAFIAGILSFLSPCVLPLIPSFMAYLSGISVKDLGKQRWHTFVNSMFFVLGFSLVFAILGILLNTLLLDVSYTIQTWLSRIAGIIIIFFGLFLLGLIQPPFLMRDHKTELENKKFKSTYLTSFVFGISFAVGWTPCVGAVLGAVLALSVTQPGTSFALLMAYAIGLGIPFLLVGIFTDKLINILQKFRGLLKYFNIVVGILLIIIGILVFTESLSLIANFSIVNELLLK